MKSGLFDVEVQMAIKQVLPSHDPLDSFEFNFTDYINQLFPTEQSLSNIEDVINNVETEIKSIDKNIRSVIRDQSTVRMDGKIALEEGNKLILNFFNQITEIQHRAEKTEDIVKEITRDIKQLDYAKKNLTTAITALNHLHMLVGGVESLTKLVENRQYGELLNPLQAITEVNHHFAQYTEIEQIKKLSTKVHKIHNQLQNQINEDFKNTFIGKQSSGKTSLSQLKDALLVVPVLDESVKKNLIKWFIDLQLEEYVQLFQENQDNAWLDKIDKRYAWLKRHLLEFESKFGNIFPEDWELSEHIAVQFCIKSREDFTKIMSKRRNEIDVKLLLFAINKTSAFELLLAKRFSGITMKETGSDGNASKESSLDSSPFVELIGRCFKPYLDIYVNSIDKNLSDILDRFMTNTKSNFDPVSSGTSIFPNCADLFVSFKKCMVQCSQLSNGKPMYELSLVFKKYLREYASRILEPKIPKIKAISSIGTSMSLLTKDIQNLSTAAGQVIHNFLKEDDIIEYTRDEIVSICCILTTAEYCLETVQQLESKLKDKIDPPFVEKVDFSDEMDIFHRLISNCIHLLVQEMENVCEPALIVMSKVQWQNISNVGDQSPFVNSIISNFKVKIPIIRENLSSSRKFYMQFCHKLVNSFIPKYITNLFKCRLTSIQDDMNNVLGCEQLLLDTHSIKTALLNLPSIESQINRKPPASYVKVVIKGMTRAEMIIKIVMAPINPSATFIEQFLKLLPDSSLFEFHKILDMKGLRRVDQLQLIELYKRSVPEEHLTSTKNVAEKSENSQLINQKNEESDRSHIKKLEKLIKKRLPN